MKGKRIVACVAGFLVTGIFAAAWIFLKWDPLNSTKFATVLAGNKTREFLYYVPRRVFTNPGLLFVLHGSDTRASTMQLITGREFDRLADTYRDFIVVYPQGYEKYWNDCRRAATYSSRQVGIDDGAFFREMIEFFRIKNGAALDRVFAAGFSNGGHLVFRLAREHPGAFRGFAAISASQPTPENDACADLRAPGGNRPVSLLLMNGTGDPVNPFAGGVVRYGDGLNRGSVLSTAATFDYWKARNGCLNARPTEASLPGARTLTVDCATSGTRLALITIPDGGHNIPNPGFFLWPSELGNVNPDVNAPALIVDFFRSLLQRR